jgi:hypothetical protein
VIINQLRPISVQSPFQVAGVSDFEYSAHILQAKQWIFRCPCRSNLPECRVIKYSNFVHYKNILKITSSAAARVTPGFMPAAVIAE